MGAEWIMQLTPMIFTRIKNDVSKKYNNLTNENFSSTGTGKTPAEFPFIYIQSLPAVEKGQDLEAISINSGLFTYQIEVTDNQTQSKANAIMTEIIKIMKRMSFEVVAMPIFENTESAYRCVARFRRQIDENDVL